MCRVYQVWHVYIAVNQKQCVIRNLEVIMELTVNIGAKSWPADFLEDVFE